MQSNRRAKRTNQISSVGDRSGQLVKRGVLAVIALTISVSAGFARAAEDAQAPNRPIRDKWALVVGISEFENPKLNLRYSAKDAADFASYLTNSAGFAPDHVKILLNKDATQRRILSELGNKWLPHVANPDDLVVIFLSTHGSGSELDIGGQNYLLAYDTDIDDLYTSAIPMQRLAHDIKSRVHCDRVIIFLDACHSGATESGGKGLIRTGVDSNELSTGSGQLVIASSKEDQISWESKKLANGVFTAVLLDTLKKQGDSTTIGKMFDRLKDDVQDTVLRERGTLQTPVMKSQWSGNDILIAGKPTSPRPGYDEDKANPLETPTTVAAAPPTPPSPPSLPTAVPVPSTVPVASRRKQTKATASGSNLLAKKSGTGSSNQTLSSQPGSADKADLTTDKPEPVNPRILLVPGQSVARMNLGMTSAEVLNLLGKPTYSSDNVITYWTSDRKYFLSVLLKTGVVTEIAFNSPAFKTASMITLSNYSAHSREFSKPSNSSITLLDGGFSIVERGNDLPVGVIFKKRGAQAPSGWWDAHSAPPTKPTRPSQN
jgi:hypothetical protein